MTKSVKCPVCGKELELKNGIYGYFYSCTNFPICKGKLSVKEVRDLSVMSRRFRRIFGSLKDYID